MKRIMTVSTFLLSAAFLICCGGSETADITPPTPEENAQANEQVLVFTKTMGYRHKSIEKGVRTLKQLGNENAFTVTQTEDSLAFTAENLNKYQLVVFLSTTQDVLGEPQQQAFREYIEGGGAYMGIHAAADTEYEWSWYGKLAGAWFKSHPEQQEARLVVVDQDHPSTAHLGSEWMHFDEWYNYKNISPDIRVLLKLDENSYEGGENGDNHPIAWYQEFEGGKVFYTGLGHTEEAYDDPKFRQHLLGGINWCLGR